MRLLFDENLSPRLVARPAALYPESQHVDGLALTGHTDLDVWQDAGRQGLLVVSKDNDFRQLSFVRGQPPKVIWLSVGNAGTDEIAHLLAASHARVDAFNSNPDEALLILEWPIEEEM